MSTPTIESDSKKGEATHHWTRLLPIQTRLSFNLKNKKYDNPCKRKYTWLPLPAEHATRFFFTDFGSQWSDLVSPSLCVMCGCLVTLLVLASGPECILQSGSGLQTGLLWAMAAYFCHAIGWNPSHLGRQTELRWPWFSLFEPDNNFIPGQIWTWKPQKLTTKKKRNKNEVKEMTKNCTFMMLSHIINRLAEDVEWVTLGNASSYFPPY